MADAAYSASYPHYCRKCNGRGTVHHHHYRYVKVDECPRCIQRRICPRCAAQLPETGYTCSACAWAPAG